MYTTEDNHEEGDEDLRGRHSMTAEDIMELHGISTYQKETEAWGRSLLNSTLYNIINK